MATVRILEFGMNMLALPESGSLYASSPGAFDWSSGGNTQWIWTPSNTLASRITDLLIDTNDVTARPNIEISDLSFSRSSAYWSNLGNSGNLATFVVDLLAGNDTIIGTAGAEILAGFEGNDVLIGGNSGDSLLGGNGNNTASYQTAQTGLTASLASPGTNNNEAAGDQYFSIHNLIGTWFADILEGNGGANRLSGGLGRDILTGNADRDLFDFNSISESKPGSANRDQISDFRRGTDDIDLKGIDAKTGVSGDNAFKFIGRDAFNDVKGELRYKDNGSTCTVQGDVTAMGKPTSRFLFASDRWHRATSCSERPGDSRGGRRPPARKMHERRTRS
jgi:Ca2+-binding RTX toxin-like protein